MNHAVHSQRVKRGHLLASVHFHREIAGSFSDPDQMRGGDNNFALGDNYPVLQSAVDNARNSISKIAADNFVYNKSRQTIGVERLHCSIPRLKAREHFNTTVDYTTQENRLTTTNRFRAAPCSNSGTHVQVHSRSVEMRSAAI